MTTTTFFFCNTTTKALCRSPVAYSRSTPFCCFVSLLFVLDFLWITSLNFVTSLTPESTTTTTTASKRVAIIIMFAVASSKSFSFVRSNTFGVSGGSGVGSSRRYKLLSLDFVTSSSACFPRL